MCRRGTGEEQKWPHGLQDINFMRRASRKASNKQYLIIFFSKEITSALFFFFCMVVDSFLNKVSEVLIVYSINETETWLK